MRTVITGMGVIAATGLNAGEHWANTLAGQRKIGRITAFDPSGYSATLAGEVTGFTAADHLPGRLLPQTDRMTQLALVAADHALADSAVDGSAPSGFDVGVVTASSAGGFEFGHRELDKLWRKGPQHVSAYQSFAWFYAVNTGQISIRHGMRGPGGVLVTEQAGGLDALALARRRVRAGQPAMVCGAVDGSPSPWTWVAQLTSGRISTCADPERAYLPFDAAASGHVPGDGGALFVMESAESATARGATSWYGEVAGYSATFDPPPGSGRPGTLRRAIEGALADAELDPAEVDVVFADAAGLPELDRAEADALRAVFGPRGVPVTAPKTMTGRLSSGGAALDVATALLALRHGRIPATAGVTDPVAGYELDLVTETRALPLSVALVVARGHGGFNAAMVLTVQGHKGIRRTTEEAA
ncbi:act minimal PKS chain-length factor (CLF/KS beta) [Nocardia tenerifensis]|uniref:Act minimal PKS chain-length factor (CLF/KS beta) n=1 Tax=Nocardia tenerifensis TaxID=228006 RepID=A0A318JTH4_9NOCA|nr:ketosynthase chain-length factor [Nocardia tenerifensis]PXX59769.1 act minimal PKS chain-length factor (CLF/KS beta) [Nocardia tenerifensis]